MSSTPLFKHVPKDPAQNLLWRRELRRQALHDRYLQQVLYDACMEDVLFWMAFACWSFEPRAKVKVRPFVPWCHQEDVFVKMDAAIDDAAQQETSLDVLLDKSRAQGGTFGYLWIDLRRWLRDPMFSAGYVTRNEKLVDSKTDSDTLFWKLDWAINRLPHWMLPKGFDWRQHRSYSDHSLLNPENGASLVGYAAGQDVGAGGRKTVFTCDEFGAKDFISGGKDESVMEALHDVTNCIRLVSARYADSGVFHAACEDPNSSGLHLILDWKDNPIHGKYSYVVREGVAVAVKPDQQAAVNAYHAKNPDLRKRLEAKGFQYEGVVRSPWYDMRCLRPTATPRLIASQLDRNPRGAVGKAFAPEVLDRMKTRCCRPPVWQGKIVYDAETLAVKGLIRQEHGPLRLWFEPDHNNRPPESSYALGSDIAAGGTSETASNSTLEGVDRMTGEQILDIAIMGMEARKFGRLAVAVARWLGGAFLGWEDSGIAKPFAKEVIEVLGYTNVFYRDVEEIGSRAKSRKAGWHNGGDDDKSDLFESLGTAMADGSLIPRSAEMIRECGEWEWEKGKLIHNPSKRRKTDVKAHADRVIGMGVAWLMCKDRPMSSAAEEEFLARNPPVGSIAWLEERERREKERWDDGEGPATASELLALADSRGFGW